MASKGKRLLPSLKGTGLRLPSLFFGQCQTGKVTLAWEMVRQG